MTRKVSMLPPERLAQLGDVVKVYRATPQQVAQAKLNRYLMAPFLILVGCLLALFMGLTGLLLLGWFGIAACLPGLFVVYGGFYCARLSGNDLRRTLTEWENGLEFDDGKRSSRLLLAWQDLTAVYEDHQIIKFYRLFRLESERTNSKYELRTLTHRQLLDPQKYPGIAETGERAAISAALHVASQGQFELEAGRMTRFGEIGIGRDTLELSGRKYFFGQIDQVKLEDVRMESRFLRILKLIFFVRAAFQGRADFYGPSISFLESREAAPLFQRPVNAIPHVRALLEMLRRQSVRIQNNSAISFSLEPGSTNKSSELSDDFQLAKKGSCVGSEDS